MIARRIALSVGLVALGALGAPETSTAQRVSADIRVGSGPVVGTIRVGDRPDYGIRGRPRHVYAAYPGHVVVERRHGWNHKNRRNVRLVMVYFDRDRDLYFDRYYRGLEQVRVYQDGDRYYRSDDDNRGERRGRNDRDRDRDDRDRYDRRDDKNRDWYYERNGRNENDGRRKHDDQH